MVYAILIFVYVNSSSGASLRKKQCNIYNTRARPIKLYRPKELGWNDLVEIEESEYEYNTITCQTDNRRDLVIILVYWLDFYNIQNLIFSTLIARSETYDYQ